MKDELLKRAKKGDEEAISILYEEYFERVYKYIALRVGDDFEAEDITQEVFIKVFGNLSKIKSSFASYLFRTARTKVTDFLRKRKERPLPQVLPYEANFEEREDLRRAISKLTDLQREVIILRFFCDLPIKDVARILGRKEGAIKVIQHDAIRALRRHLEV